MSGDIQSFTDIQRISTRTITDEGFMQADADLSMTGVVEYMAAEFNDYQQFGASDPDDIIRVYRPPDTLFQDSTLKSFANKPVTNGHPVEGKVTPKNARREQIGHIGDSVNRRGNSIRGRLTITDENAIKDVQNGILGLSVGYNGRIVAEKGFTGEGEQYDAVLQTMVGNHVALTDNPRARDARILDSKKRNKTMSKVKINGIEVDVNDSAMQAVQTLIDQSEADQKEMEVLKAKLAKMADERKEIEAQIKKLSGERNDEAIEKKVQARLALVDSIHKVLPEFDCNNKTAKEIKIAFVHSFNDTFNAEDKSNDYIDASFDTALTFASQAKKEDKESDKYGDRRIQNAIADSNDANSVNAQKEPAGLSKLLERNRDSWK